MIVDKRQDRFEKGGGIEKPREGGACLKKAWISNDCAPITQKGKEMSGGNGKNRGGPMSSMERTERPWESYREVVVDIKRDEKGSRKPKEADGDNANRIEGSTRDFGVLKINKTSRKGGGGNEYEARKERKLNRVQWEIPSIVEKKVSHLNNKKHSPDHGKEDTIY